MTAPLNSLQYLGRQPILGREQQLLAFALVLQDGLIAAEGPSDDVDNTVASAFAAPASEQPLGPYRAFIQVDHDFLMSELIESLPPALAVLKLNAGVAPTDAVVERCRYLCGKGFALAIEDSDGTHDAIAPLLDLAEIIAIDVSTADAAMRNNADMANPRLTAELSM